MGLASECNGCNGGRCYLLTLLSWKPRCRIQLRPLWLGGCFFVALLVAIGSTSNRKARRSFFGTDFADDADVCLFVVGRWPEAKCQNPQFIGVHVLS